jgi:hypothetical protein
VIFRVYEAGTNRQDASAAYNARELRRLHVWYAVYAFTRPGNCAYQANRTVAIVRRIGGSPGGIIDDAEIPLPRGAVACFVHRVEALGYPAGTYTSCGTVSEVVGPLWDANYGVSSPCRPFDLPYAAWQFADNADCAGYVGDCSYGYGIREYAGLWQYRAVLRADIARHDCRTHPRPSSYSRVCRRWLSKGAAVNRQIDHL